VQTTLLGLAVAIILALVTALVGPLLVDWNRYRPEFEAQASRIVGLPVQVNGAIDARLLPSPSLVLRDIAAGDHGELKARSLSVEFALGPLLRGEWRASELHLDTPDLGLGLDPAGRLAVPTPAMAFDPDQVSIDRLVIDNGRLALADAASGSTLAVDKLSFRGELRSLSGPFKGEGAFVSAGELYGFRLSGGRGGDGMKLRLALDAANRPLVVETDGMLAFDDGTPRYDGSLVLTRPVGTELASGRTVVSEPLKLTGRVKATPHETLIEQVEVQYGPEDRATRLTGTASLRLGARPEFQGVLSARQLDLDRAAGAAEGRRPPVAALQALLASFVAGIRLPLPVKLGLDVDALTLGGAALQAVRGDVQSDGDAWTIDTFEFRAPGLTQVRLSGRVKVAGAAVEFTGPASVESSDPRALVAWLEGRPEGKRELLGALRARGDVTLGSERIAIERLKAEIDRKAVDGRLAYIFAIEQRKARLEAALSAAEIDIDGALAFLGGALKGATFERPGEIALALSIGKATYAGIDANRAEANLRFDASGLNIERLNVSDFRGASLSATGLIDTSSSSPRGGVTVALNAEKLDGVIAVAAKWAPQTAEAIRRYAPQLGPAKVNARFEVEPAKDKTAAAKLALDGRLGVVRLNLTASGTGDPGTLTPSALHIDGTVEADEGAVLAALVGVDRYVAVDMRPAALSLLLDGPPGGELRVDAKLAAGGLWGSGAGTLRLGKDGPNAKLDLSVSASEARVPGRDGAPPLPVALNARLALANGRTVELQDLSGNIAGSAVAGRLALTLGNPLQVEGRIAAQDVDASAAIAALIGVPARAGAKAGPWGTEPFGRAPLADVAGRIELDVSRATLSPALQARELRGIVRLDRSGVTFENVEGALADGSFSAAAEFRAAPAGIAARGRFSLDKADMAALVPPGSKYPVAGRLSLTAEAEGTGLSPAALVGALQGKGTLTVENVQIAGLDPRAIDAAIAAADRGMPLERVPGVVPAALNKGRIEVAHAVGAIAIDNGRVRLADIAAPAKEGVDVAVAASLDLIEDAVDTRITLSGPGREDALAGRRPELSVTWKGPWGAPQRGIDSAALMNWVTLRTVEREARRLEAAEREAKLIQEAARRAEAERAERQRLERERAEAERAETERAERERQASTAATGAVAAPVERAPELPPPIDIKPAPVKPQPRAAKPPAQAQAAPPPPAPPPPAQPRTPLQILQGWFGHD
jgi:large subunit ribosomal protein L24